MSENEWAKRTNWNEFETNFTNETKTNFKRIWNEINEWNKNEYFLWNEWTTERQVSLSQKFLEKWGRWQHLLTTQMERSISVWPDRNARDLLWRLSALTGLVISVGRTKMSLSIWQMERENKNNKQTNNKHTNARWFVSGLCNRTWKFRNFKPEFFVERKAPRFSARSVVILNFLARHKL